MKFKFVVFSLLILLAVLSIGCRAGSPVKFVDGMVETEKESAPEIAMQTMKLDNEYPTIQLLGDKSDREKQEAVLRELYFHTERYKPLLLKFILDSQNTADAGQWDPPLETVLFIVALSGDTDFADPISKLINNTEYVEQTCVYDCALIFSLSVLCHAEMMDPLTSFTALELDNEKDNAGKLKTIRHAINDVSRARAALYEAKASSVRERTAQAKASINFADSALQARFEEIIGFSPDVMLTIARDRSRTYTERIMAMYALSFLAESEDMIPDILALISFDPGFDDASDEFRGAGIKTIRNILIQNGRNTPCPIQSEQ